jgi:hypothetical protein
MRGAGSSDGDISTATAGEKTEAKAHEIRKIPPAMRRLAFIIPPFMTDEFTLVLIWILRH